MKYFFGCTFMNQEELEKVGVCYPVKLDYYITKSNRRRIKDKVKYGIEIVKTSYIKKKINIEKSILPEIVSNELQIENILNVLKKYRVTPISAEYIVEDLLKEQ